MRSPVEKQIGSLKTLTIEGSVDGPCVIFFHGYGADAADLLPLSDMLGLSTDVTWVFPEAPMEVIIAPGFYGKAWYPIDTARLERALMSGEPADLSKVVPEGIAGAQKRAASVYEELIKRHTQVVVGGFSQGAMLATDLCLRNARKPAALVIMSGVTICQDEWIKLAPSCNGVPFVQSHGKNDALLGYQYGEQLYDFLSANGLNGDFLTFSGGHEIPPKVIEKIGEFLNSVCQHAH